MSLDLLRAYYVLHNEDFWIKRLDCCGHTLVDHLLERQEGTTKIKAYDFEMTYKDGELSSDNAEAAEFFNKELGSHFAFVIFDGDRPLGYTLDKAKAERYIEGGNYSFKAVRKL